MATEGKEQVLYITLIDFLLQLLFMGLVIGVLYAVIEQGKDRVDPVDAKNAFDALERLRKTSGISDLTELTDELARLAPIREVAKDANTWRSLRADVDAAGGVEKAKQVLADHVLKGQGKPSCLPEGKLLISFHAYEDRIEVESTERSRPDWMKLLRALKVDASATERMSFAQFRKAFDAVPTQFPDCRYNVQVIEHSPYRQPRDVIRRSFAVWQLKDAIK